MTKIDENGTLLLVDDEDVVLNIGTLMLRKLGYKVIEARNGKEAMDVYAENKDTISLVILDMILPDEPGTDICIKVKAINQDVKILHSSGLNGSHGNGAMECGCKQFLPKPFRFAELSEKVKEVLEIHARS